MNQYYITRIGAIEKGVDGTDEYILIKDVEDDINVDDVYELMMSRYYRDTNVPGGYFCNNINIIPKANNEVIAIVEHRYDC